MSTLKSIFNAIADFIPPIHKEGFVFIYCFGAAAAVLYLIEVNLGWVGIILFVWCAAFFRDPVRSVPTGASLAVSPADGLVQKIEKVKMPEELGLDDDEVYRVSIFLNVFNVHVNRAPLEGKVTSLNYHPGKFLSANLDKASQENERQSMVITTKDDKKIVCVQIAGLIARRIVCDMEEGDAIDKGQRYGLIRFGSRVDIYLPKGVTPQVVEGQTAIGGETIIADLKSKAKTLPKAERI